MRFIVALISELDSSGFLDKKTLGKNLKKIGSDGHKTPKHLWSSKEFLFEYDQRLEGRSKPKLSVVRNPKPLDPK